MIVASERADPRFSNTEGTVLAVAIEARNRLKRRKRYFSLSTKIVHINAPIPFWPDGQV
jgi:hypothetical protein